MDYNTKLNGEDVVLRDVTDPAYVAPVTGYVIHLDTPEARRFVRAELDENRASKDEAVARRDENDAGRLTSIARRDSFVAAKAVEQAEIDNLNLRIAEQRDFLQAQGDTTE